MLARGCPNSHCGSGSRGTHGLRGGVGHDYDTGVASEDLARGVTMARDIRYKLARARQTFCPHCDIEVVCLMPAEFDDFDKYPGFYICPNCVYIGQLGVGPVGVAGRKGKEDEVN